MTSILLSGIPFQAQGGDQLVSKVAGAAIAALFKRSEKVEANVRAEPVSKLLTGSLDGFDFIAKGLLMYNGLRIDGLELFSQAVSIDFSAIFQGRVSLRRPTQCTMRVALTEEDLSVSFNTPFVLSRLQLLKVEDKTLEMRSVSVDVGDGSLTINSEARLGENSEWLALDFTTQVELIDRRKIQFVDVKYRGTEAAVSLSQVLVEHVNNLLDLSKFALDGTQLRVDRVRVREGKVVFYGTADIERFPKRKAVDPSA